DSALYNYFSKNKEAHICGRFFSTQVDRPIYIPHQPESSLYRLTIALALTLLFTQTPHLLAQNRPPKIVQTDSVQQKQQITANEFGEISGTVTDEKKEPL